MFFYTCTGNPTTAALEGKLAALEGAEDATVGASGMAAVSATLLSLLDAGDHLVASSDLFVITRVLLDDVFASKGIEITHVDVTDLAAVHACVFARRPRSSSSSRCPTRTWTSPTCRRSPRSPVSTA